MELCITSPCQFRNPTFADVRPYRRRSGVRPKKVAIAIPHSSVIPVALPFSRALSKKLMENGIQTDTLITTDMMKRGWELRSRLGDVHSDSDDRSALSATLTIEDFLIRTSVLLRLLSDPGIMVLELHAYNCERTSEYFSNPYEWRRLAGTDITVQALHFDQAFSDVTRECSSLIDKSPRVANGVAQLRGMDLGDTIRELREKLRELKAHRNRIKLVELPSIAVSLPRSHPAFGFYFSADGSYRSRLSSFETSYCAEFRKGADFSERDVRSVASILVSRRRPSDTLRTMPALTGDDL